MSKFISHQPFLFFLELIGKYAGCKTTLPPAYTIVAQIFANVKGKTGEIANKKNSTGRKLRPVEFSQSLHTKS